MISLAKLPVNTQSLYRALVAQNKDHLLDDFLLIGGTALTMRIGHRTSEDLDFAIGTQRLPTKKIQTLLARLEQAGFKIVDATNPGTRDDFENDGLEIENYQQDWIVNDCKLTFFTYGNTEHEQKTISESCFDVFEGIKIASIDTIAKTKCLAMTRRTKSRDLFDIYHLIETGNLTIEAVIAEMQQTNAHLNYDGCIHRLLEKPIQKDDEGLNPIGVGISVEQIREYLAEQIDKLEIKIAKNLLQQGDVLVPEEGKQYIGAIESDLNNRFIQSVGQGKRVAHQRERVGDLAVGTTYTIKYNGPDKAVSVQPEPSKGVAR